MANNELLARAEASATPWLPPPPGLFTSAYDTTGNASLTQAGNAAITQPGTTDFSPQGNATIAQAQIPTLTSDQTAMLFASLGQEDMTKFAAALPAADQQTLATALSQTPLSFQTLSQAFSQIPQGDIQTALAALPPQDLQTVLSVIGNGAPTQTDATTAGGSTTAPAFTAGDANLATNTTNPQLTPADAGNGVVQTAAAPDATNQPVPQARPATGGSDLSTQLSNLTPDQITKLLSVLPQQDSNAFMQALPPADQQSLTQVLQGQNVTAQLLSQALAQLPQQDVIAALGQVPRTDLQTALQEVTQVNPATKNGQTDAPAANATDAAGSQSSGTNWVKWGAASLAAGGGGYYAYKKFDLGTKLAGLKDSLPDSFSGLSGWASKLHLPKFGGGAAVDAVTPVTSVGADLTGGALDASKLATVVPEGLAATAKESIGAGLAEKVAADGGGALLTTAAEKGGAEVIVDAAADLAKVAEV